MKHALRALARALRRRLLSDRERAIEEWKASGMERRRLEYDLDERSVVVDVGGYEGQWASDVFARFRCTVHVYEPVAEFAGRIRARFGQNPQIVVHDFGLAGRTRADRIYRRDVGSSVFGSGGDSEPIRLVRAADAFAEAGIEHVDLIKLNVEGGEYELLEHLLDDGWISRIRHLQVQFHDNVPEWRERLASLRARLEETHELEWRHELVWESWRRRA